MQTGYCLSFNATQFHSYAVCAVNVCYIVRLNECFIWMFTRSFIPPTRQEAKCLKLYRHEQGSVTDLNTEQGGKYLDRLRVLTKVIYRPVVQKTFSGQAVIGTQQSNIATGQSGWWWSTTVVPVVERCPNCWEPWWFQLCNVAQATGNHGDSNCATLPKLLGTMMIPTVQRCPSYWEPWWFQLWNVCPSYWEPWWFQLWNVAQATGNDEDSNCRTLPKLLGTMVIPIVERCPNFLEPWGFQLWTVAQTTWNHEDSNCGTLLKLLGTMMIPIVERCPN